MLLGGLWCGEAVRNSMRKIFNTETRRSERQNRTEKNRTTKSFYAKACGGTTRAEKTEGHELSCPYFGVAIRLTIQAAAVVKPR
jgi:hypothetical protein